MSRAASAVGVALVLVAAVGSSRCASKPRDVGPPPATIVSAGCPFEGCQYGTWTATRTSELFSEPDGLKIDLTLSPGDVVQAASGEIHSSPRRARVMTAGPDDESQGIRKGDTIYALYPIGEGALALWHNGLMKSGSLDLVLEYDPPVPKNDSPLKWTWWVKVTLVDGTIAWLKNPKNFSGMDKRGRP